METGSLNVRSLAMAISSHHGAWDHISVSLSQHRWLQLRDYVLHIHSVLGLDKYPWHGRRGLHLILVTLGWVGADTDHPSSDTGGDQCLSTVSTLPRVFSDCYQGSLEPFTIYFLHNPSVSLKTVQFPRGAVSATCWLCAVSLCLCKCQVPTIRAQLQCDSSPCVSHETLVICAFLSCIGP